MHAQVPPLAAGIAIGTFRGVGSPPHLADSQPADLPLSPRIVIDFREFPRVRPAGSVRPAIIPAPRGYPPRVVGGGGGRGVCQRRPRPRWWSRASQSSSAASPSVSGGGRPPSRRSRPAAPPLRRTAVRSSLLRWLSSEGGIRADRKATFISLAS